MTVESDDPAFAGQAKYTALSLKAYDLAVYSFTVPVLWKCSKRELVGCYEDQVSGRHLDIGVASGALLDECRFPVPEPELTLMDLNPDSIAFAARRLRRYAPRVHQANVLEPWKLAPGGFESVAMMNLLHCVPGTIADKAVAFDHAEQVLVPGGTLFGATILGKGVPHTRWADRALRRLNRSGAFSNLDDSLEDLESALAERFPVHRVDVCGCIGMFIAKTDT
jgi:hypothetical protein